MGSAPQDPRPSRRERLERAAAGHEDLPEDIIEHQVQKAEEALDLLGDEDEMLETAAEALEKNLATVEDAMTEGAEPAHRRVDPCAPDPPAGEP